MKQSALAGDLSRRNARVVERTIRIRDGVTAEAMQRRPAANVWSPAEVVEHLVLSDEVYLREMRPLIAGADTSAADCAAGERVWRPSLMGRLLVWGLTVPMPVPTSKLLEPRGGTDAPGIGAWITLRREIDTLIERGRALDWRALRFTSPIASTVKPNLGDAFLVLVVHAERHLKQIEERSGIGPP